MKKIISIGNRVDDGTGDYLRRGGQKVNDNFTELYYNLGDGNVPHAAGAWKIYSSITTPLVAKMGQSWVINTTQGRITVNLPEGTPTDYGKVIKFRDVYGVWGSNPVQLIPAGFNTIKGGAGIHRLEDRLLDVELVYCAPGNWEYVPNKYINSIRSSDMSTVAKKEYIATEGQTDFSDILQNGYNPLSVNVYKRGNLLFYGNGITENSDYGSITPETSPAVVINMTPAAKVGTNDVGYVKGSYGVMPTTGNKIEGIEINRLYGDKVTNIVSMSFESNSIPLGINVVVLNSGGVDYFLVYDPIKSMFVSQPSPALLTKLVKTTPISFTGKMYNLNTLDGQTIRLLEPCESGDVVIIETFLDGLASYRSSYETASLRVYDSALTPADVDTIAGKRWVGDLPNKYRFSLDEFGFQSIDSFNPKTVELLINGRQMIYAGSADIPTFVCEGSNGVDETECLSNGGVWVPSGTDYSTVQDVDGRWRDIVINSELDHKDIITIRWFNNDIGSLLEMDEILEETDGRYLNVEAPVNITGKILYTDIFNPSPKTVRADPNDSLNMKVSTVQMMFDMFHPVGTIYENAHNPNNPASYMGMGVWVRYAPGTVIAGWNSEDPNDPIYGLNYDDTDQNGTPRHSSGGRYGSNDAVVDKVNTPETISTEKALIQDPSGDVLVGGCQYDPDEEGPGFRKYREDFVRTRPGATPLPISIVQPIMTAHRWLRVE